MNLKQKVGIFCAILSSFFVVLIIQNRSGNNILTMAEIIDNESFGEEDSEKEKEEDYEEEVEEVREHVIEEDD